MEPIGNDAANILVNRRVSRGPLRCGVHTSFDFDNELHAKVWPLAFVSILFAVRISAGWSTTLPAMNRPWFMGHGAPMGTTFKNVPENPVITDYVKRVTTRPSVVKVAAMDAEWVVEHERAAKEINS